MLFKLFHGSCEWKKEYQLQECVKETESVTASTQEMSRHIGILLQLLLSSLCEKYVHIMSTYLFVS